MVSPFLVPASVEPWPAPRAGGEIVPSDHAFDSILNETLFATGVLPYYLHLMDRVRGAARFEVDAHLSGRQRARTSQLRRRT